MYHAAKHLPNAVFFWVNSITNYEYYKKRRIWMEDEQHYLTWSPTETMKCMRCQAKKHVYFRTKKHPRLRRVFDPLKIVVERSVYLGQGLGSSRSLCTKIGRYFSTTTYRVAQVVVETSCWLRVGILRHSAWAVRSHSGSPPAAGTVGTKLTGGFYRSEWSPCIIMAILNIIYNWFLAWHILSPAPYFFIKIMIIINDN